MGHYREPCTCPPGTRVHATGCPATYTTTEGHAPAKWTVVSDAPLVVHAMCTCGNDDCAFVVSAHHAVNTNINATGLVALDRKVNH